MGAVDIIGKLGVWMAWTGITRERMKGPGAVWSVCTDISGPAMQGGSRGPA